jgi:large subunit ribosomal protein L36e
MSETNGKSGIFVGLNRGKNVAVSSRLSWKTRPVLRKGRISKRSAAVREIIREVAGFSPLEKRMMEMIRTGVQAKEKRAVKLAKQKLGTHRRAQHKRDELVDVIAAQKKKGGNH